MKIASADPCKKVKNFSPSFEGSQMISWTSTGFFSISSIVSQVTLDA